MFGFHDQCSIFLMGALGAFIWVFLCYRVVTGFAMETRLLGRKLSIVIWCLVGGIVAWLFEATSSYGLHPMMLCALFAGFGWSGLFTGVVGLFAYKKGASEANDLIRDLGE